MLKNHRKIEGVEVDQMGKKNKEAEVDRKNQEK